MKYLILFTLSVCISACNSKSNNAPSDENNQALPEPAAQLNEETEKPNYVFVVIVVEEPTNVHRDSSTGTEDIEWTNRNYATKIDNVYGDLNSEMKARMLDNQEDDLRQTHLNSLNARFSALSTKATAKIIYREVMVFESYEAASSARQKVINGEFEFTEKLN